MALFPFILYNLYERGRKIFFIGCCLIVCLGILIISKAAILSAIFSVILILYYKAKYKKAIIGLTIAAAFYFIFIFNLDNFLSGDAAYLQKAIYAYNKGGLIELLLSSRQTFEKKLFSISLIRPLSANYFV